MRRQVQSYGPHGPQQLSLSRASHNAALNALLVLSTVTDAWALHAGFQDSTHGMFFEYWHERSNIETLVSLLYLHTHYYVFIAAVVSWVRQCHIRLASSVLWQTNLP